MATWHEHAACRGTGSRLWFSESVDDIDEAASICVCCPVRRDCDAAGSGERSGTWAGVPREPHAAARYTRLTPRESS